MHFSHLEAADESAAQNENYGLPDVDSGKAGSAGQLEVAGRGRLGGKSSLLQTRNVEPKRTIDSSYHIQTAAFGLYLW